MKSFDTKDLKVFSRKFESSQRKHLDLEESANDFQVSNGSHFGRDTNGVG